MPIKRITLTINIDIVIIHITTTVANATQANNLAQSIFYSQVS